MTIYEENGFKDRDCYLQFLAERYGFDYNMIVAFANILGIDQDFARLVETLEAAANTRDEDIFLFEDEDLEDFKDDYFLFDEEDDEDYD